MLADPRAVGARDALRVAVAAAAGPRQDPSRRAALSAVRHDARRGDAARDRAPLRQHRPRRPRRARPADRRLHVRERAAGAPLRHSRTSPARRSAASRWPIANRRGLFGHGSILTMTSVADRTSPVLRGKWVLEVLLGMPPPPPPPDVPDLDETKAAHGVAAAVGARAHGRAPREPAVPVVPPGDRSARPRARELRRRRHVAHPRQRHRRRRVRRRSTTARRSTARSALRAALLKHKDDVLRTFTENLMAYALGRRVEHFDMPTVRGIVRDAGADAEPFLVVRPRDREEPGVSDEPRGRRRTAAEPAAEAGTRGELTCICRRSTSRGARSSRAWARPSRCRSSTRWCRRGRCWRRRRPPARRGSRASRWCTAPPAARRSAWPRTCGRRPRSGASFDLSPSSLSPLEPFRDYLTIVSNTDCKGAEAVEPTEIGGDHFRSSAVFLTQTHPKQTEGSDVKVGAVARPALRAAVRAGHADPVDAAVHRERRPGRRLRLRLRLRLHRHHQLGGRRRAAADGPRSARGVRPAVRRRRDAGASAPPTAAPTAASSTGSRSEVVAHREGARPGRPRAASIEYLTDIREIERRIQRSSRTTPAASRASCRARRWACPTRSASTSS